MSRLTKWFERQFPKELPDASFLLIVERLRGAPACLEDRLADLPQEVLTRRCEEKWTIQEIAGHLLDLEPLWLSRVEDFVAGREVLHAADLSNRKTHEANHNAAEIAAILGDFRAERALLVERLEALDAKVLARTALHPRLGEPMRVIELGYFVAEHDLHHLAQISERLRE